MVGVDSKRDQWPQAMLRNYCNLIGQATSVLEYVRWDNIEGELREGELKEREGERELREIERERERYWGGLDSLIMWRSHQHQDLISQVLHGTRRASREINDSLNSARHYSSLPLIFINKILSESPSISLTLALRFPLPLLHSLLPSIYPPHSLPPSTLSIPSLSYPQWGFAWWWPLSLLTLNHSRRLTTSITSRQ